MLNQQEQQSEIDAHKPIILIIEDDDSIGTFLVDALSQETGYKAVLVTDGLQALQVFHTLKPSLMITDYRLPHLTGIELYDMVHSMQPCDRVPTIIMSAHLPVRDVQERHLVGINKPFELDELLDTVESLLAA